MNQLTVVIPSKNITNLTNCLFAVRSCNPGLETIVIDDGLIFPKPGLEMFRGARLVAGEKPFIFARNANRGILAAGSSDVILLNDDSLLDTLDGFTSMQRFVSERADYGLVAARTNLSNDGLPFSLSFVCVLIPRRTIDEVGLLDERFTGEIDGEMVYGGEDDDYCYRVRAAGLKIDIFEGCVVDHSRLQSTFRPDGKGLPINATQKRFHEIHGFEMRTK